MFLKYYFCFFQNSSIDEIMPKVMMEAIQIISVMTGILVVVMIVNPVMIAALIIAIIFFSAIVKLYMRPSQDLKRLEGICKSCISVFKIISKGN